MTVFKRAILALSIAGVLMLTGCDVKADSVLDGGAVNIDSEMISNLEYTYKYTEVTDEMVSQMIYNEVTKGLVNSEPVTGRGAESGDTVVIDFNAMVDGVTIPDGQKNDVSVVLGSGMYYRGFEMELVGVRAGEDLDITVDYPLDYENLSVAGKSVRFVGTVKSVSVANSIEIDDKYIKDHTDYTSLKAYSEYWKGRLKDKFDKENRSKAVLAAVQALAKKAIPDQTSMTESEQCEAVLASVAIKLGCSVSEKEISKAATEYSLKFGYENTKAMEDSFKEAGCDLRKLIARRLLLEQAAEYVFEHAKRLDK